MRVKMSKQPPPAPTASAVGPCPTVIRIVGRPGTGSFPCTIAPPDHPKREGERGGGVRKSKKHTHPRLINFGNNVAMNRVSVCVCVCT